MNDAANARRRIGSLSTHIAALLLTAAGSATAALGAQPAAPSGAQPPAQKEEQQKLTSDEIEAVVPILEQKAIEGIGPAGEITRAATKLKFADGSVSDAAGNVYFADRVADCVYRLDAKTGEAALFLESIDSPAGLAMLDEDSLAIVQSSPHAVTRVNTKTKAASLIVEAFVAEGSDAHELVRPNDLAIDAHDGMYVTDTGGRPESLGEMPPGAAVYYITKDESGKVTRAKIIDDLLAPTGVALSSDGKTLYVLAAGESALFAYDVAEPGKVENKRELSPLLAGNGSTGVRGGDGLTIDSKGNLYLALPNALGVQVVSPKGELLGHLRFGEKVYAVCFGGTDHKTLYVSGQRTLYAVPMEVAGRGAGATKSE